MDARLVVTENIVWTRQATIVAVTTVAQHVSMLRLWQTHGGFLNLQQTEQTGLTEPKMRGDFGHLC